ncbi:MAG TPA: gliding motility-associated C-terminal domain-containing protein, partial [Ferruginibacter sp.]|nr:gliding motility-associated C-terminal domain-containing protein [Ferruginibacter sp.]
GASGGTNYSWTPITWLDNPNISNPVSRPQNNIEYVVRVTNDIGCFGTDSILVKVYKVSPGLFVPNAFTPNGDGNNDIFRPVAIGMKSVDVFQVYNRWGQMLYAGTGNGAGWDGKFGGRPQEAATYVWYAEGVDYLNNKIKKKGTVILIR